MALAQRPTQTMATPARQRTAKAKPVTPGDAKAVAKGGPRLGDLATNLGFALRLAQLAVFRDFNEQLADENVSTAQFSALYVIGENPGLNQTALADALRTETPRMVGLIDTLARRGYVTRLASTVDRRSSALYLTADGAKKLRSLRAKVARHDRAVARRLCHGDRAALLAMLRDVAEGGR